MLNKTLLILISTVLALTFASSAYGQSTEVDEILAECETILDEVAGQRDRAIEQGDKVAQERDEARGRLLFLIPEYETLKQENRQLLVEVADQPSRWVWLGIGLGTGVVVTVAATLALVAL